MADEYVDPSGKTEAFRAFAHAPEWATNTSAPAHTFSKLPMLGAVVVAAVLLAMATWIALS